MITMMMMLMTMRFCDVEGLTRNMAGMLREEKHDLLDFFAPYVIDCVIDSHHALHTLLVFSAAKES